MGTPNQLRSFFDRIAAGDAGAYKQLFLLWHQPLVLFAASITHSRESAEEVVSDVFLILWKKRQALTQVQNPKLYLYVITRNLSINAVAKQKRQPFSVIDKTMVLFASLQYHPDELLMTKEMHQQLLQAIHQLPPRCQTVFKLVKEDGLSYKEVAGLMHLSVKTVENQITIALRKIGSAIRLTTKKNEKK